MLKEMIGTEAVGYYASALRIAELWYMIPIIINQTVFPYFIELSEKNYDRFMEKTGVYYKWMIWVAVILTSLLYFGSDEIIILLYGEDYRSSIEYFSLMVLGIPVVFFSIIKGPWTLVNNRQSFNSLYTIIGAVINVSMNYIFIKILGGIGAIYSTIIAQVFVNIILPFFVIKDRVPLTVLRKNLL